jgi:hypothetical protein
MALTTPKTRGFLLSFHALSVLDDAGDDVGIREIGLKNTMKGKGKVWGKARKPLGLTPGAPDWTCTKKWNLDHWTQWAKRHPGYADDIFDLTFDYLTKGLNYTIELNGVSYVDEDHQATEGADGGLEKTINFTVIDVRQFVDNVEIPYLQDITQ